jgi:hypothetical protein
VLCSKLRQFSYEEIEFFLPQLCHLLISIDNESMALEEFIIDLCEESVNGALLVCLSCTYAGKHHSLLIQHTQTFWLFQTYLNDLSFQPASNAFQTCRRIYNKVQSIVFGGSDPVPRERIQDNVLPVTVLSSLVLASIAVPMLPGLAGPLAIAQARRPRPVEEELPETLTPVQKIGRSHTVSGTTSSSRRAAREQGDSKDTPKRRTRRPQPLLSSDLGVARTQPSSPSTATSNAGTGEGRKTHHHRQSLANTLGNQGFVSSHSLPDQRKHSVVTSPTSPGVPRRPSEMSRRNTHNPKSISVTAMTRDQKIRMLRQNYFRTEMQFLTALEGISSRLVAVPKPARLSALRAELALIAQDLPAEVDVPFICPATLVDGAASKSRHHRIVRLNPAEATSLNSAAKVPYLLMLEVIHEDFDFDPDSEENQQLMNTLLSDRGRQKRKLFDTSDAARAQLDQMPPSQQTTHNDSVFEPTMGDLGSPALLQGLNGDLKGSDSPRIRGFANSMKDSPRLSTGVSTLSSTAGISTPRNSDGPISRSSTPGGLRQSPYMKSSTPDQAEVSALATHMRTASQMLAQLELSAAKRPKAEVAAIKAKIIASMQTLEEQSFLSDDAITGPSFETIMARANEAAAHADASTLEDDELASDADPAISSGRGAARMENDMKTGGVQRKGDRDDPSAATVGEAWEQKKERIRRSSPYGWVKNWDLVSVIVKTGDDLRQEAFACQLIEVCSKIWTEHAVDVWVKNMRILVTGESSGLIETITNAVSLHSLKRSLTLAALAEAAPNARSKGIATLQDHYAKTFGAPDSPAYTKAVDNFARSLAAYSIICYILQLKDRHNGNILIDAEGHVIHIDFGFMLSNSPGNMGFEAAPFKFPLEYLDLLGGLEGTAFLKFKEVLKDAFQALRREAERIVMLVELMGRESKMPSYGGGLASVVAALRARFVLEKSKEEAREWVEELVAKSVGSYYTRLYDTFQYRTQGIY